VTTGFGRLSEVAIPPERLAELQVNLVRSHASGVGPHLSREATRAMMLLRANVLARATPARGRTRRRCSSGCSTPGCGRPFRAGQRRCSGDLAPLAHLGLAMIGEGELHDPSGTGAATACCAAMTSRRSR
jgi:histidine ammonia-lyase